MTKCVTGKERWVLSMVNLVITTTTTTTVLRLSGFCPGLPGWAGTER